MTERSRRETPSSAPDLSVVLPSYRAADRAVQSVGHLSAFLESAGAEWEILVIDDGGGDFPAGLWNEGRVRLVRLPERRGKGAAVRAGMLAAKGSTRSFTDVDLPFDLELLLVMHEYVRRGFHIVIGDRTLPDSSYREELAWPRRFASRAFSSFVGKLVTGGLFDTQCGLKAFRADVAETLFPQTFIDGFAFDVELLYLALKSGLDIKRLPVQVKTTASSSINLLPDSIRMFCDLFRIKGHQTVGRYDTLACQPLLRHDRLLVHRQVRSSPRLRGTPSEAAPADRPRAHRGRVSLTADS